jgi:hypothetical protein
MATVAPGARLVLHTEQGPVPLRCLAEVPIQDQWTVPVLAAAGQLLDGLAGQLELPTDRGLLHLQAHLVSDGAVLSLRPGLGVPLQVQRRDDVRAEVRLPVRAVAEDAVHDQQPARTRLRAVDAAPDRATVAGTTVNVSAGGLRVRLNGTAMAGPLHVELDLPEGRLVPAVLAVLDAGPGLLRARFDRIDPVDRERLVRLVFEQQRRELAARRRLRQAWPEGVG